MTKKSLDVVAIGTCYIDTNVNNFPFTRDSLMGEELIGAQYEVVPGGSAVNFCRLGNLLGLETAFIGMAGSDPHGDLLANLLEQQGVRPALVQRPDLQTNIGFNITNSDGEHLMFVAGTANTALTPEAAAPQLEILLPQASLLYLGGCLKLQSFMHAFTDIALQAKHHNAVVAVDHGRVPEGVSQTMRDAVKKLVVRADYYFPSREEFCTLWNVPDIAEGLRMLHALAPNVTVIAKDGAHGAYYLAHDSVHNIAAPKIDHVVNATGAGDSFNAGVIAALAQERPLSEAVDFGCRVAAAKITASTMPLL